MRGGADTDRIASAEPDKTVLREPAAGGPDLEWYRHTVVEDGGDGLAVPRLELRWDDPTADERVCIYSLVYRHLLGDLVRVPLGRTKQTGRPGCPTNIENWIPFRDGAHFRHDVIELRLPGFVVVGSVVHEWRGGAAAVSPDAKQRESDGGMNDAG